MIDLTSIETELVDYYDREADERASRPLEQERVEDRSAFIARLGGSRFTLLELGTGAGRDVSGFVDAGFQVVGIDLSYEQSRYAADAGASQVVASARHLPLADQSFSALWTMSVLMHIPNNAISATLTEIRRVMAPGALAAIGAWGGQDVEDHGNRPENGRRLFSRRTDETWRGLLARLGEIQEYETRGAKDDFWYQWAVVRVPD